jgi:hypothetical protein
VSVAAVVPVMLILMLSVLMIQLQSFSRLFLVLSQRLWVSSGSSRPCFSRTSPWVSWRSSESSP